MLRSFVSVGALTGLSRLTGFLRDLALGAALGASPLADAFFVALRLPNQFRAIFGEGAFNSAFVPAYSRVLIAEGDESARVFGGRVFSLLLISQLVLLGLAWAFADECVDLLAPGFRRNPENFAAAVEMTRITFPYLLFVTLATLHTATQNAHDHFAVGAFAPVLLNLFIVGFLAAAWRFPNAGIAASVGVTASGVAQFVLLFITSWRYGTLEGLAAPKFDHDVRLFFAALGPAILGSAGQQVAILVDTILASKLPTGSVSSIYYADRLYQLPLGMIGVAAGTVLLPEMSRRLAAGDEKGAAFAQNRSLALTLLLALPFVALFLAAPGPIVTGAFLRGAFDQDAALRASAVLAAYALGLAPMVLLRSNVAGFQARGDTTTPMLCFFAGLGVNLTLKFWLWQSEGARGLALATSAGAWTNFLLLVGLGGWRGYLKPDRRLVQAAAISVFACGVMTALLPAITDELAGVLSSLTFLRAEAIAAALGCAALAAFALLAGVAALIYRV